MNRIRLGCFLASVCLWFGLLVVQSGLHALLNVDVHLLRSAREYYAHTRYAEQRKAAISLLSDLAVPALIIGAAYVRITRPERETDFAVFAIVMGVSLSLLQLFYLGCLGLPMPWLHPSVSNLLFDALLAGGLCAASCHGAFVDLNRREEKLNRSEEVHTE